MTPLEAKVLELRAKMQRQRQAELRRGNDYVPRKKDSKPVSYKMQNTFERSLRGVPAGGVVGMIAAPRTGCKVRKEPIGLLRSARNCNTTSGSYVTTVVSEDDRVVSDPQGRKAFGR